MIESLPTPLYLLGNIKSEESEKKALIPQGSGKSRATAPYLLKEHPEGKKGEKILVLVHFSESRPDEGTHRGEERTGD